MSALTPRINTVESNTPAGVMFDYAGTAAPSGFMMCDGASLSTATYSVLFAAIGYSYGGSGANFNVPDFRGRFARYNDNMGTGAAGLDTGRVHGSTQTQATAPNGLSNAASDNPGDHQHTIQLSVAYTWTSGSGTNLVQPGYTGNVTNSPIGGAGGHTNAGQTISGDSETRPINLSCNKIIKI